MPPATQAAAQPSASQDEQVVVYITKSGKNYHREGCRWLSQSMIPISFEDAKRRGCTPCATCKPPE